MQRHGNEEIGVREDVGARPRHPARHRARDLGAVGIFEPVDKPSGRTVLEAGDGAGAREDGRVGHRLRRQEAVSEILLERRAETLAIRPLDEPHPAPALRAERPVRVGRGPAGETGRRIEGVDDVFRQTLRQTPRERHRARPQAGRGGRALVEGETRVHDGTLALAALLRDGTVRRIMAAMSAPPPHEVFDRALANRRLDRAWARGASGADFLLRRAAGELVERLSLVKRRFACAADVGTPGPHAAAALAAGGQVDQVLRLAPTLRSLGAGDFLPSVGDVERLPLADGRFDLAVSLLALQTVNDLPGALIQMRRALAPDGLIVVAMIGGDTLTELRQSLTLAESEVLGGAAPRVAPFVELRALGGLAQRAGLALPVVDLDRTTARYRDMLHLMRDLRSFGAANALAERSRSPLRREVVARAAMAYAERFSDPDGRIRATFDVLWLSAWAPHESQPKPLKPVPPPRGLPTR